MADRIWIEPGNRPRQTPGTLSLPVGCGQTQSKGFKIRLERQEGNLVAADSQNVEIIIDDDMKSALVRYHRTLMTNEQGVDDKVAKITIACCAALNISLDDIFFVTSGNPRQSSDRFGGFQLEHLTAEELLDVPCEFRREAGDGQLHCLGQLPQLDHLFNHSEVSIARTSDPILLALADRLPIVQAVQSGQIGTIFVEVDAIDDSWKRGRIGTQLFGASGHVDGQRVSASCEIGGKIASLGRIAAYHIPGACSSATDYRVCGDEELFGLLHRDLVLEDMFAGLISWIFAHESNEDQDMIIWPSTARFATDIGRELSEAERSRMPSAVFRLEKALKSKVIGLDVDHCRKLKTRAQAVASREAISWRLIENEATQQCGSRWSMLAELIEIDGHCDS